MSMVVGWISFRWGVGINGTPMWGVGRYPATACRKPAQGVGRYPLAGDVSDRYMTVTHGCRPKRAARPWRVKFESPAPVAKNLTPPAGTGEIPPQVLPSADLDLFVPIACCAGPT